MSRRSSRLLSPQFISLYVAAAASLVLSFGRHRWGSAPWFPLAIGVTAAMAIVPLRSLLEERLLDLTAGNGGRIVFFFLCGLVPLAAVPFMGRDDALLVCGCLAFSALFFWAASGRCFAGPDFVLRSYRMSVQSAGTT
jgi:hypothetical protein